MTGDAMVSIENGLANSVMEWSGVRRRVRPLRGSLPVANDRGRLVLTREEAVSVGLA
jgi:hypothetical protein